MSKPCNRLLLFVHYNRWGGLAEHVVYLLQHVRKIYCRIVCISNSHLSDDASKVLSGLCDELIQRENKGFDFSAWKDALYREGKERLTGYDSVTLMNDTCFGPLFDLRAVYRRMEKESVDFWGLTNHRSTERGLPFTDGPIPEHIQSYFLCFKKNVIQSSCFWKFWESVDCESEVGLVISKYETQLTQYLCTSGFAYAVHFDTKSIDDVHADITNHSPNIVLQHKVPFLKVKSLFQKIPSENMHVINLVRRASKYPVSLIYRYLEQYFDPDESLCILNNELDSMPVRDARVQYQLRVGLHIHAFYLDVLQILLDKIGREVRSIIDIVFTTDSAEKAESIRATVRLNYPDLRVREVLVCKNTGRDVWPWLCVAPLFAEYDMVGHLHTKKSVAHPDSLTIDVWRDELYQALLGPFESIYRCFTSQPWLGVVIPDLPSRYVFSPQNYDYSADNSVRELLPEVWRRLGCERHVDFAAKRMLVFSYGNMFWYRPAALRRLWEAGWTVDEMPCEPLPTTSTLLHALERLPVYVAWAEGYSFRLSRSNITMSITGFQYAFERCNNVQQSQTRTLDGQIHALNEHIDHLRDEKRELIQKFRKLSLKYAHMLHAVR